MKKPSSPIKVYLASSWRNEFQPSVVEVLRKNGFDVYDFRNPCPGNNGFSWKDVLLRKDFDFFEYLNCLSHPIAEQGFNFDFEAMQAADICVLLLPCGRSAHLEAGWMIGAGKPTYIVGEIIEPELMYKMANGIFRDIMDFIK